MEQKELMLLLFSSLLLFSFAEKFISRERMMSHWKGKGKKKKLDEQMSCEKNFLFLEKKVVNGNGTLVDWLMVTGQRVFFFGLISTNF